MSFSGCQTSRLQFGSGRLQRVVLQGRKQQFKYSNRFICASTAGNAISNFVSVESALEDLRKGKPVVVLDDESRENEGDLIINADRISVQMMAFIVEYTSGVICVGMRAQDLDRLDLPLMVEDKHNEETMYTAFTVTVDAWKGITTGISAADRTKTVKLLGNPNSEPSDFRKPGHIFPLRSRPGGVLERPGHTEASVDLARLSGSFPAGVICEIVDKRDGSMARGEYLFNFAQQNNLKCLTVRDLQLYRLKNEQLIEQIFIQRVNSPGLQNGNSPGLQNGFQNNQFNQFQNRLVSVFKSVLDDTEHVVIERVDEPLNGHARNVQIQFNDGFFLNFLGDNQNFEGEKEKEKIDVWIFIGRKNRISCQEQIQNSKFGVDLSEVECGYVRNVLQEINVKNFQIVGEVTEKTKQNVELFMEKQQQKLFL